jgi:MFS family permease
MTGMYIMAVAFILFLPHTSRMTVSAGGTFEGIKEGLKYLRHETTIVIILVFTLFVVILSMPYSMLLPVLCDRVLNVGEAQAGILMSVSGIGAITGSIALASLPNKKRGLMLLVSCLVLGLSLAGFAFSTSWFVSMALIVIVGLANTGRMTLGNTLIQYYVDNNYRGRVMSIYMMEFGLVSFGTFAAGIMAETIGVQWAIGGFALVLVFMALVAFISLPRIRKLD